MMEQTMYFEKTLKCNLHHCRLEKKELNLSDYGKNLYRNNQVFSLQLNQPDKLWKYANSKQQTDKKCHLYNIDGHIFPEKGWNFSPGEPRTITKVF